MNDTYAPEALRTAIFDALRQELTAIFRRYDHVKDGATSVDRMDKKIATQQAEAIRTVCGLLGIDYQELHTEATIHAQASTCADCAF